MKQHPIILKLIKELKAHANVVHQKSFQRFFLEPIKSFGIPKKQVLEIGKKYFKLLESPDKKTIFGLCEQLFATGVMEPIVIAMQWAHLVKKQYEPSDFELFERWLQNYVTNWAACDDFCAKPLSALLNTYPELIAKTDAWVARSNPWLRRASVVVLIYCARDKKYLPLIFQRCSDLLCDKNIYVQKGYGWLLKKTSAFAQQEVFNFVMSHKQAMPRLALRYAIEKMAQSLKSQAMA